MMPELYSKDIKYIIKVLETTVFYRKFPKRLRVYLLETYKYGDWPYGYHEGELESMIFHDAIDYFNGRLDTTIKPPLKSAFEEVRNTRGKLEIAIETINDLEEYIDELHMLLWANDLDESRDQPEDELYPMILKDSGDLIDGSLYAAARSPLERAYEEIDHARDHLGEAISTIFDLEEYIDGLHELLWANGLEGSRMLHDETGEHKGTYAEFNTLCPEDCE